MNKIFGYTEILWYCDIVIFWYCDIVFFDIPKTFRVTFIFTTRLKSECKGWLYLLLFFWVEVSGFGLIRPEIKSNPICAGLGWVRIHFLIQVGLDFGSEKCHRFGFGFTFDVVTDLDSGLGSFCTTGWVGFWIWEISWGWIWIRVHFLRQVGSVSESIIFDGFGFGFGLKLYYRSGRILDLRIS